MPQEDIVDPLYRWMIVATRFSAPAVTTLNAFDALDYVLANVGANFPVRDAHDARIINDVKNRTGKYIDDPSQVGGWLNMNSGSSPTDSDQDGMPDSYENDMALNPYEASDGSKIASNGYTNLENYLNGLVGGRGPALTETPTATATPTPTPLAMPIT